MDYLSQAQEKEILAELGLTLDQALALARGGDPPGWCLPARDYPGQGALGSHAPDLEPW